ncbi:cytochrome P450 2F2-like [Gastrophryne carolinensis]
MQMKSCAWKSTAIFLDVKLTLEPDGSIGTNLYRKPTAVNSLLEYNSSHIRHQKDGIPYGLRARRNCTQETHFEEQADILKSRFLERGYPPRVIHKAYVRARRTDRSDLLCPRTMTGKKKESEKEQKDYMLLISHHVYSEEVQGMELTGILFSLLVLIFSIYFIFSTWNTMYRKRNLPPGPTPLPIIGNLLNIEMGALVKSLMKLWKQYGSVYTVYFGSNPVVMVCGYEAVKEAFVDQNDAFGARGKMPTIDAFSKGLGINFSNGERWKILRTFTFKTLKDFGFGKKSIEWKVQEEAQYLVEEFRKAQGQPLDPLETFMKAASNILFSIAFGDRYSYTDEKLLKVLQNVADMFRLMSSSWGQVQSVFPAMMNYIPGPHHRVVTVSDEIVQFADEIVKTCQATFDPSDLRHFTDCYLAKMEKEKDDPNTEFTMNNLLMIVHNLFMGATDTITTTMRHALLVLMRYPEVEEKIQKEIVQVIGRSRMPNLDDRASMPYTQAVMDEVQRFCDLAPHSLPHMTTKDVTFRGYSIPKGTDVYPLLCTVHRDATQFATPYKFNPNHFLDENGKYQKNDACMPFSAGKRYCPGDNVARMEFFLFLTSILQNFKLSFERKLTDEDIAPNLAGFVNCPLPFKLSFIAR